MSHKPKIGESHSQIIEENVHAIPVANRHIHRFSVTLFKTESLGNLDMKNAHTRTRVDLTH